MKAYLWRFLAYLLFAVVFTFAGIGFEFAIPKMMSLLGLIDLSVINGLAIYVTIAMVICAVLALFKS